MTHNSRRDLQHPVAASTMHFPLSPRQLNRTNPSGATSIHESKAMRLSDRLTRQLKQSREFCEKLFEAFKTPEDWTHQIAPGTNHALWFAGHMATADNFFI